jgi:hypothetical protein
VKILLDECVDQRFRRDLVGHEVITVQEAGWAGKKNGELLALARRPTQSLSQLTAIFIFSRISQISTLQSSFWLHAPIGLPT